MSSQAGRDLLQTLDTEGLIDYGKAIPADVVRKAVGVDYPELATKKVFDQLALTELAAVDYVRNILLGRGMYLAQSKDGYRILLPSENVRQVEMYMRSADRKLNRALKLTRNTPRVVDQASNPTQIEARILMKKLGARVPT